MLDDHVKGKRGGIVVCVAAITRGDRVRAQRQAGDVEVRCGSKEVVVVGSYGNSSEGGIPKGKGDHAGR